MVADGIQVVIQQNKENVPDYWSGPSVITVFLKCGGEEEVGEMEA